MIDWQNFVVPSLTSDLATGHLKAEELLNQIRKSSGREAYHCLWDLEPRQTFKQYKGLLRPSLGFFWFDFDHEESKGEQARLDVIQFIEWVGVEDVVIFFSGNKGFHVGIPEGYVGIEPSEILHKQMRSLLHKLGPKFKTLDLSVHDAGRKFRVPGSRHPKTGLYKRRISSEELLLPIEQIARLAKNGHGDLNVEMIEPRRKREVLPIFEMIKEMPLSSEESNEPAETAEPKINSERVSASPEDDTFRPFQSFPKKKCIERLFKSHAEEGTRHQIALILVQDLKQTKINKLDAITKINKWAKAVSYPSDRLGELTQMIEDAYSGKENYFFSCHHPMKSRFCSSKCDVYKKLAKDKRPFAVDNTGNKKSFLEEIYKQKGFYLVDPIGDEKIPLYESMANWTFSQKNMAFNDAVSLKFDGKKWDWLTKTALYSFVRQKNEGHLDPQHLDNFIKLIKASCFYDNFNFQDTDSFINLNNGILSVKTGELLPHSYQYPFKYVSPVDYSPLDQCPEWEAFLNRIFEGKKELIDLVQKMFGYIIIGGDPFLHKAFCLVGSGRNGKSTLLEVLKAVVGKDSYSTVSMGKLDKEFSLVSIDGKLANIVEETPNDEINSEAFKTMVAGGEVRAAHKGFDEYSFKCKARFVFACNDMPIFKDKNVSMLDRLIFIPFNRYFEESERDPFMAQKLKMELSGILNWAVKGAEIVLKDKIITTGDAVGAAKQQYLRESDSVYAWFMDNIIVDKNAKGIATSDCFEKYKQWSEEEGSFPCKKHTFGKRMRTLLAPIYKKEGLTPHSDGRISVGAGQVRGFAYIFYK